MVLVIIGLISGVVLVSRDLILIAQVRRQVTQIEQINTAVNTFKGKFNCLPGDCANAVELGLGEAGGAGDDGDGDGVIDIFLDAGPPVTYFSEATDFWYHLGRANLLETYPHPGPVAIPVPGVNSPPLALSSTRRPGGGPGGLWLAEKFNVGYDSNTRIVSISPAYLLTSSVSFSIGSTNGVYLPQISGILDRKIDDGLPESGNMIVAFFWNGAGCINNECGVNIISTSLPDACVDESFDPPIYSINPEAQTASINSLCMPIIKAQF